ncbi:MAG TPA: MFS transporter [Candidatus Acidoferrales bacterium]|nr:MFS transporter [Candidatus Acidoferrales bacterium]
MSAGERLREIRAGFQPSFWVANFTEIFERLAYYGTLAVLGIYLNEQLHFSAELTGSIIGMFGLIVYFLPTVGGALADRFGFRRALLFAYAVLTIGYFLLGSLSAPWMQSVRSALGDKWLVIAVLLIPALGPATVKPCVAGTIAKASTENVRSLGYSIYYTLVNVGGTLGPGIAWLVRKPLGLGMENVFRTAALSVFLMFWVTLFFYREPLTPSDEKVSSLGVAFKNLLVVLRDTRFVIFLLITSGFYIAWWQIYIMMPLFIRHFVNPNANTDLLLLIEGSAVICLQIVVAYATRRMAAVPTIALGFMITGLAFVLPAIHPTVASFAVMLIVIALGEVTQASRYYEYCSRLAPEGQEGLYMGYAFPPIGLGSWVAGLMGGWLLHEFGDVLKRPTEMWWPIVGVGVITAALMLLYDRVFKPTKADKVAGAS